MKIVFSVKITLLLLVAMSSTACLTRRTVTEGGVTVKESYVIKRPIKSVIDNSH